MAGHRGKGEMRAGRREQRKTRGRGAQQQRHLDAGELAHASRVEKVHTELVLVLQVEAGGPQGDGAAAEDLQDLGGGERRGEDFIEEVKSRARQLEQQNEELKAGCAPEAGRDCDHSH